MNSQYNVKPEYNPKVIHYRSNGTGRDEYISYNNGGICFDTPMIQAVLDSGKMRNSLKIANRRPGIPAKQIHYKPDGTGRDFYVCVDDGGLSKESYLPGKIGGYDYLGDLRKYRKSTYGMKSPDFLRRTTVSLQEYNKSVENYQKQKLLIDRLSTPKDGQMKTFFYGKKREESQKLPYLN